LIDKTVFILDNFPTGFIQKNGESRGPGDAAPPNSESLPALRKKTCRQDQTPGTPNGKG
jgi:hypothetical protein